MRQKIVARLLANDVSLQKIGVVLAVVAFNEFSAFALEPSQAYEVLLSTISKMA